MNFVNNDGETALFYAARRSQPAIARLLLQRGADCSIRDRFGDLPVDHVSPTNSHKESLLRAFEQHTQLSRVGNRSGIISTSSGKYEHNLESRLSKCYSVFDKCTYNDLLYIFEYLCISDVLRCACVATKWHRVSENPSVWMRLGIRKWELALQSSLGFLPSTTSSFYKPPLAQKPKKSVNKV